MARIDICFNVDNLIHGRLVKNNFPREMRKNYALT